MNTNTPTISQRLTSSMDTRAARLVNPTILKFAGTRFRSISKLKHIGRRSGREYATPVAAFPLGDGFVFALLYGDLATVDWCRNVMVAGNCSLKTLGQEHKLVRPEMIPASQALDAFPPLWRFMLRARGILQFLWVHHADIPDTPSETIGADMTRMNNQGRARFLYKFVNPILRFLVLNFAVGGRGDQDVLRILRVQGRKSGRLYDVPVRFATMNHQRYILSMLGESQWVRNLRAAGTAQLILGQTVESVEAHEVRGDEKAAFLAWYCQHPQYAQRARYVLKMDTKYITPADIARLADKFPLFRLEPILQRIAE